MEGRGLHNNGLSEGTSAVLRGGGTDGNEIGENSRQGFIEMLKYYPLVMPKIYVSLF